MEVHRPLLLNVDVHASGDKDSSLSVFPASVTLSDDDDCVEVTQLIRDLFPQFDAAGKGKERVRAVDEDAPPAKRHEDTTNLWPCVPGQTSRRIECPADVEQRGLAMNMVIRAHGGNIRPETMHLMDLSGHAFT
ncbi:unnamed protein product [Microthlaspi erraticum]|uniref:Uncharacterized protein n=1 Tax=Microthlaspi erraticum TaxID=1685480 RepID=A0A6D2IBU6_9BRAS|nr:unnamed protein product [Microthlaspi erraticum]